MPFLKSWVSSALNSVPANILPLQSAITFVNGKNNNNTTVLHLPPWHLFVVCLLSFQQASQQPQAAINRYTIPDYNSYSPQRICKEIVNVQNSNLSCNCACSRSRRINIELTLQFEAERGIILFMDILPGNQVDVQEYLCKWVWKYPGSLQKQVLLNRSVFWLCVQLSTARFKQGHQDGKVLEIIYILNQL